MINKYTIAIIVGLALTGALSGYGYKLYRDGIAACERKIEQAQAGALQDSVTNTQKVRVYVRNKTDQDIDMSLCAFGDIVREQADCE